MGVQMGEETETQASGFMMRDGRVKTCFHEARMT